MVFRLHVVMSKGQKISAAVLLRLATATAQEMVQTRSALQVNLSSIIYDWG